MLMVEDSWSWRLKTLEVDGSSRGHELRKYADRLSSIYEAFHVSHFDWILYRIEASLHLPCISHIYNTLLLLISTLFSQNILSERHRQPCQSTPSNICTRQLYNRQLFVTQRVVSIVIIIFSKSCILCLHFARPTHPSVTTRSVSLKFCRRL